MAKKFYRSRKRRVIAGLCAGLAEYFNVDPLIVRLITLILVLSAGGGLIASHYRLDYHARRAGFSL